MSEKSIEDLKQRLHYEGISRRLREGQTRGKIASDLNLTQSSLRKLFYSDEFLKVLQDFDEELAEDLKQEKLEGENKAYETVLEEGATEAASYLVGIISGDEKGTTAGVAASKAIIELAERVSKKGQDLRGDGLGNLPKRQWDMLKKAIGEVDAQ